MSYLRFDKTLMTNLEESLQREILRTNKAGAYHCTTIVDCNTRKYHGLLVIPVPNLDEFRLLLDASYGTRFHNFVDELVRIEVEYTYKYMETVGYPEKCGDALTEKLLHIVTTSRFESIFEIIRHHKNPSY